MTLLCPEQFIAFCLKFTSWQYHNEKMGGVNQDGIWSDPWRPNQPVEWWICCKSLMDKGGALCYSYL